MWSSTKRLKGARRAQYGTQIETSVQHALEQATRDLTQAVATHGHGSLYAMLSPMMACEEAWLLGTAIRQIDPKAVLVLGLELDRAPEVDHPDGARAAPRGVGARPALRLRRVRLPFAGGVDERVDRVVGELAHQPFSSDRTFWGSWLAWASIAVPAWLRIWFLVMLTVSSAMSTSRMRDSAATRFSW